MKNLIYFVLIIAVGYWGYSKCSGDSDKARSVLKQVTVTAKTANLRTGPGTGYDIAVDHDSVSCQVKKGMVLDVIAAKDGWYEVRVDKDSCTAFIKQSLCADLNAAKSKKNTSKRNSRARTGTPATSSKQTSTPSSASDENSDGVVEEVSGSPHDDEVIF